MSVLYEHCSSATEANWITLSPDLFQTLRFLQDVGTAVNFPHSKLVVINLRAKQGNAMIKTGLFQNSHSRSFSMFRFV
jgi:hypothetical protein